VVNPVIANLLARNPGRRQPPGRRESNTCRFQTAPAITWMFYWKDRSTLGKDDLLTVDYFGKSDQSFPLALVAAEFFPALIPLPQQRQHRFCSTACF